MKINKVASIVFSPCGGTLKASEAVMLGMPGKAIVHDLTRPSHRPDLNFGPDDLVVFGFPVYAGRVPGGISEIIFQKISGRNTPAVLVAVYGNREFEGALLDLDKLAKGQGFRPIAAAAAVAEHSIATDIAAGRPDDNDRAALADFGRQIYKRLAAQPDIESFSFEAPGAHPEHKAPGGLKAAADPELCIECGICPAVCPVAAIPESAPQTTGSQCICCMACIHICPQKARDLQPPKVGDIATWLKTVAGERKEPRFFF